jgi:hypothetical protein
MKIRQLASLVLDRMVGVKDVCTAVTDPRIIEAFAADPDNTFLVSFPRTGSHWLRMLMEVYFGRPSLVRVFYYPERRDYLTLHTHDLELDVERTNVLYLYRDPVPTVFSQLCYHAEPLDDHTLIVHWSELYGRHLDKWLYRERFTKHKTILTYEGMKQDLVHEFGKITDHFAEQVDEARLAEAASLVTKNEVRRKTQHDTQVVQARSDYDRSRLEFSNRHGALVWEAVTRDRPYLEGFFAHDSSRQA